MAEFFTTPLGTLVIIFAQCLAVVGFVMISLLFLVYGDRKVWAAVQMRRGPNVVGPWGLLQTVADALKYVVKEVVVPAGADKTVFIMAPLTSFVLAVLAWAVIPLNEGWVLSDINVAVLFVFAVSSVAGYQVEYTATPFLLFMAGEYIAMFLMCALISLMFFGGWLSPIPGLPDGVFWMIAKMAFFFFLFAMVKAITPRYRYDQLMRIGWKVFLPLSLGWVVIVAFLAKFEVFGGFWARWAIGG